MLTRQHVKYYGKMEKQPSQLPTCGSIHLEQMDCQVLFCMNISLGEAVSIPKDSYPGSRECFSVTVIRVIMRLKMYCWPVAWLTVEESSSRPCQQQKRKP